MVFPKHLQIIYSKADAYLRDVGFLAGKSGRHMKFPYTMCAKVAQFPYAYYMKHNNICMYFPLSFLVSLYLISKIHAMANSESNQRSWAETQLKAAEKEKHH